MDGESMSRAQRRQKPSSLGPPEGLDPKRRPGRPGTAASAPIAQAHSFRRFRGRAGVRSEPWVPPPRPSVVTCRGRLESREAQVAAPLSGESEKRKGKPEGVEVEPGGKRRLREEKARGLRAHPPLARPAAPLPPRPGDSWARPPRAAAPPPGPAGAACGARCQSATSGAVFESPARIATVPPGPIAAPAPGCRM